jgi:hypothetical protein
MADELTAIPKIRQVYYLTYANLPTSGLTVGDLGFATDRLVLYRWSGAAWQNLSIHSSSGLHAAIPAAADLPAGSVYFETDTQQLFQIQGGAWVAITTIWTAATINDAIDAAHVQALQLTKISFLHTPLCLTAPFAVGQGTFVLAIDANAFFNVLSNSTQANGDNVTFKVWLKAGTYSMHMLYRAGSTGDDAATLHLDGATKIDDINFYNGSATNTSHTVPDFSIAADGEHTFTFTTTDAKKVFLSEIIIGRKS